jgi:hypothetical protein
VEQCLCQKIIKHYVLRVKNKEVNIWAVAAVAVIVINFFIILILIKINIIKDKGLVYIIYEDYIRSPITCQIFDKI